MMVFLVLLSLGRQVTGALWTLIVDCLKLTAQAIAFLLFLLYVECVGRTLTSDRINCRTLVKVVQVFLK
jgi:hypothetical protein